jgi:lipopolysaccharide exporter
MKPTTAAFWIRSGFFSMLQNIAALGLGMAGFLLLVRVVTKEEFGVWVLLTTITTLIELTRNGMIQNALVKFAGAANPEQYPSVLRAAMNLNIILTAAGSLLVCLVAHPLALLWSAPALESLLYLFAVLSFLSIPVSQSTYVLQTNMRFTSLFYTKVVNQGTFVGGIAAAAFFGYGVSLSVLLGLQTLGWILSGGLAYYFTRGSAPLSRGLELEWMMKLFHFGKFTFGTTVSSVIFNNIDTMMLGAFLGTPAVASYNAAFRIANVMEIPMTSLSAVVFPKSVERSKVEGPSAVKYLYERSVGSIFAMTVPAALALILFSQTAVRLIAGAKYQDAAPILTIVVLFSLIKPFGRQFGIAMESIGKPRVNFSITLTTMLINIASNYFYLHFFGFLGAAYGTLTALVIGFFITRHAASKELGIKTSTVLRHALSFYAEGFHQVTYLIVMRKERTA